MIGTRGPLAPATRRAILVAFQGALRLETHVLAERPELLWQQLANRLQWDEPPAPNLVDAEAARRREAGADPWLRLRAPMSESRALVRTLAGHTGDVTDCAFSPDGATLASAGEDGMLRLWDVAGGRELASLPLPADLQGLAWHPWRQCIATGGRVGQVHLTDVVGLAAGAPIRTAVDRGVGPAVRCPVCGRPIPLAPAQLGREMACPWPGCAGRVRVNPFVVTLTSHPAERKATEQPPASTGPERRPPWRFWRR